MSARRAVEYARRFIGHPYRWGGNGPAFDCSGLVCEVLKSVGVLGWNEDLTAAGLFTRFRRHGSAPVPGALAFFGPQGVPNHVAIMVDDRYMIEAGGGTAKTIDLEDAQEAAAFVRERPVASRSRLIGFYLPEYPADGQ